MTSAPIRCATIWSRSGVRASAPNIRSKSSIAKPAAPRISAFRCPKRELFPETYHYRSRFTADVLSGMKSLVDSCEQRFGSLTGKKVVDIGCNDGSLLDFFSEGRHHHRRRADLGGAGLRGQGARDDP